MAPHFTHRNYHYCATAAGVSVYDPFQIMEILEDRSILDYLPEDIVRLVFEIAAETGKDGLVCATVSKRVQSWVEPIIYRDVIVDLQGRFHRTVTAPDSTKPPKFFATHVKCLLFNGTTITSHVPDILEKCYAVQSLALWVSTESSTPRLQALLTSRLLTSVQPISVSHFVFGPGQGTFSLPILRDITHLNVLWPEEDSPWVWGSLVGLSSLTHLEVDIYFSIKSPIRLAKALVEHCPLTVRILIMGVLLDGSESGDTVKEIAAIDRGEVDFRVVLCGFDEAVGERLTEPHNVISMAGAVDDWGRPSTTPYTIWDQAMGVVERRLALRSTGGN